MRLYRIGETVRVVIYIIDGFHFWCVHLYVSFLKMITEQNKCVCAGWCWREREIMTSADEADWLSCRGSRSIITCLHSVQIRRSVKISSDMKSERYIFLMCCEEYTKLWVRLGSYMNLIIHISKPFSYKVSLDSSVRPVPYYKHKQTYIFPANTYIDFFESLVYAWKVPGRVVNRWQQHQHTQRNPFRTTTHWDSLPRMSDGSSGLYTN